MRSLRTKKDEMIYELLINPLKPPINVPDVRIGLQVKGYKNGYIFSRLLTNVSNLNIVTAPINLCDMCIFVFSMCNRCETYRFHKKKSFCCGSPVCGRYEYFQKGFPIDMCMNIGLNGKSSSCPCNEFCSNLLRNEPCSTH